MKKFRETEAFSSWFEKLRDTPPKARINQRLRRFMAGNPGDFKPVGEGVSELRIDYGPGYRVYFLERGDVVIILLCGGDKSTQDLDIKKAKALASGIKGSGS